jgi:hypothetical protein
MGGGGGEKEKHINGRFRPVLNPTAPDAKLPEYGVFDISCVWVKGKVFRLLDLWELEWTSSEESPGDPS